MITRAQAAGPHLLPYDQEVARARRYRRRRIVWFAVVGFITGWLVHALVGG